MDKKSSDFIAQCYVVYGNYVKSIISQFFSNWDDIEDIFHDVFLKMLKVGFYSDLYSYVTKRYIAKTTRNLCISRIRRKNIESHYKKKVNEEIAIINELNAKDIEDSVVEGMVISTLYDVIHELEYEEQKLIMDKYFNKKKYVEIAREQGVPYYVIKKKLNRVNSKIKSTFVACHGYHNDFV